MHVCVRFMAYSCIKKQFGQGNKIFAHWVRHFIHIRKDGYISLSLSLRLPLCFSCSYYHARITRSRWRHRKAAAYAYVCVRVCVCVSFLIFLILLLLLFTIYLLKLLISLFAEERKPRGNLAYCYWCRCFLSPATVARSCYCIVFSPLSPIPFTFLSLSLFLCFSLSVSLLFLSLSFLWQIQSTLLLIDSA